MCRLGDIIVIKEFKGEDNILIKSHSFIVVDDNNDEIKGLPYDFIATIMSSFKNTNHKNKMLSYKVNKEITNNNLNGNLELKSPSYVKTNKLYYFNKRNIKYKVIGRINDEYLDELVKIIISLDKYDKLSIITTNLS